jgi:hypothetical protein
MYSNRDFFFKICNWKPWFLHIGTKFLLQKFEFEVLRPCTARTRERQAHPTPNSNSPLFLFLVEHSFEALVDYMTARGCVPLTCRQYFCTNEKIVCRADLQTKQKKIGGVKLRRKRIIAFRILEQFLCF